MIDHEDQQVVTVPRWAMLECGGDARDAMVLAQITWWFQPGQRDGSPRTQHLAERDGFTWMWLTDADLGAELGMHPRRVCRARAALVHRGLLECKIAKVDGIKRTLVRPVVTGSDGIDQSNLDSTESSDSPATETSNQLLDDLVQLRARAVLLPEPWTEDQEEPPPTPPSMFEEFWKIYPLRSCKPAAVSEWRRAIRQADPTVIIAGALTYASDPNRKPNYTAQPANWLRNERWNDEPARGVQLKNSTRSLIAWAATRKELG